jgi:hypothetical protein
MRRTVLLTLALLLATAAPAAAESTTSVKPDRIGKASRVKFNLDGLAAPVSGRLPSALEVSAPGFRMDLRAVRKRCSEESAKLNECPRASRIGSGSLLVVVTAPDQTRVVTIPLTVYLRSSNRIVTVAKVFGWQVVPGTLARRGGFTMTFSPLPKGPPFPGVSYTLKAITLDFHGRRTITRRKVRKVHGKRRVRVIRRHVNLVSNPRKCGGTWATAMSLTFPDGSVTPVPAPVACSSR